MTKNEIAERRNKFLLTIRKFEKKKFDARPLLPEFYRLTEQFKMAGGNPEKPTKGLTKKYWDDPANRCNEHLNHWPIVFVGNGIYKREYKKHISSEDTSLKTKRRVSSKHITSTYYKINVIWDGQLDDINSIKHFFDNMCIKQERQIDSNKLTYIYKGTEESFKTLKRATLSMINVMYPSFKNITVYGKQIKE